MLAAMIVPAVTPAEAEKSVELLLKLGLLTKKEDGTFTRTSASFTTGSQVRSVAVANYHKAMMRLASESIERIAASERDISSVTVAISQETYRMIRERLQRMRRELLELAETDKNPERVVQLNLQLFPLSEILQHGELKS
jgi:uncharacterized protein (TIGR02147 family)